MTDFLNFKEIKKYLDEKDLLIKLRSEAAAKKIPIIEYETGAFLEVISILKRPQNVLEIGCGAGYSSYFLIKNLGNNTSYTGIDLNRERLENAQKFIFETFIDEYGGRGKNLELIKINFIHGNALKIIPVIDEVFDLVFIDAAKLEYPLYIKSLTGKLSKNAVVIADNVFYNDKIFESSFSKHDSRSIAGLREYVEFITTCEYFENHFLDIGDGIALSFFTDS
ncbi:MAG: methyltransferase domain-containing protein [Actinobacteria bacterium]|nr:methyltransferase domain-containing protein [Actinomycetota bacterium]